MGYLKNSLMESIFKAFSEQLPVEIIDYMEEKMNTTVFVEEVKDKNSFIQFNIHEAINNSPIPLVLSFRTTILGPSKLYTLYGNREVSSVSFEEPSALFDFMNKDDGILAFVHKSILLITGGTL